MQVTDETRASTDEPVARRRSAVERWLSLTGAVPLPVFLALHLSREAALSAPQDVAEVVRPTTGTFGALTMVCLVWVPLLLHAGLGTWLLLTGRKLTAPTGLADLSPLLLRLSRMSSVLALGFVILHASEYPARVWLGEADARDAGFRLTAALSSTSFGVPVRAAAYLLGLLATLTHASIGIHRALLAEGVLSNLARRRISELSCAVFALVLFCVGAGTIIRVASGVLLR